MKISQISASKIRTFIPEFNGNRDLPSGEQIRVQYKAPTAAMKDRLFPRQIDFVDEKPQVSIIIDRVKVLQEMVASIENLSYDDENGKEISIVSARELLSAPIDFDPLVEELYVYLNSCIQGKVDEKN